MISPKTHLPFSKDVNPTPQESQNKTLASNYNDQVLRGCLDGSGFPRRPCLPSPKLRKIFLIPCSGTPVVESSAPKVCCRDIWQTA